MLIVGTVLNIVKIGEGHRGRDKGGPVPRNVALHVWQATEGGGRQWWAVTFVCYRKVSTLCPLVLRVNGSSRRGKAQGD